MMTARHLPAAILNVQRACQAALDLGQHIVRRNKLGVRQSLVRLKTGS